MPLITTIETAAGVIVSQYIGLGGADGTGVKDDASVARSVGVGVEVGKYVVILPCVAIGVIAVEVVVLKGTTAISVVLCETSAKMRKLLLTSRMITKAAAI